MDVSLFVYGNISLHKISVEILILVKSLLLIEKIRFYGVYITELKATFSFGAKLCPWQIGPTCWFKKLLFSFFEFFCLKTLGLTYRWNLQKLGWDNSSRPIVRNPCEVVVISFTYIDLCSSKMNPFPLNITIWIVF